MEEQTMEVQTVEEQTTGCLVCGAPLEYLQSQIEMECTYCHKTFMSNARCVNGHFICDSCHEQMGLRVPEDVQVIGYDGLRWMNTGQPFVSSIYQDTGIIAKTSVDCLMRLLNGEAVEDIVDLPIVFQDGGTTLPLPETDIKEKQGIMLPILEGEDRR